MEQLALQVALGPTANLQIQGSLLQLRGSTPGVTPVKDGHGSLLVLNGELCERFPQPFTPVPNAVAPSEEVTAAC